MTKAEEIARQVEQSVDDDAISGTAFTIAVGITAATLAMEWAAQQCESDARQWTSQGPSPQYLAAKKIRAGKSLNG